MSKRDAPYVKYHTLFLSKALEFLRLYCHRLQYGDVAAPAYGHKFVPEGVAPLFLPYFDF